MLVIVNPQTLPVFKVSREEFYACSSSDNEIVGRQMVTVYELNEVGDIYLTSPHITCEEGNRLHLYVYPWGAWSNDTIILAWADMSIWILLPCTYGCHMGWYQFGFGCYYSIYFPSVFFYFALLWFVFQSNLSVEKINLIKWFFFVFILILSPVGCCISFSTHSYIHYKIR